MPTAERFNSLRECVRKTPDVFAFTELIPGLIEMDRLKYRKPGSYEFDQIQDPESHLFPEEQRLVNILRTSMTEHGMTSDDINHVMPALNLCLYGHSRHFRDSGEPYTTHPIRLAIEALNEFREANWKTIVLCLLHDIKENSMQYHRWVSPEMIKSIYTQLFRGPSGGNYENVLRDAKYILRTMDDMTKIMAQPEAPGRIERAIKKRIHIFPQEEIAAEKTVAKFYETLIPGPDEKIEDADDRARVALVELLDKRYNMRTLASLKDDYEGENKRRKKANDALHIWVPMAHAFHLYKLEDDLATEAIKWLYPDEYQLILKAKERNDTLLLAIRSQFDLSRVSPELAQLGLVRVDIESPSFYETFKYIRESRNQNTQFLKGQLIIDDVIGTAYDSWYGRAHFFLKEMLELFGQEIIQVTKDSGLFKSALENTKRLSGALRLPAGDFGHVDLLFDIVSTNEYISSHASVLWDYSKDQPEVGNIDQWKNYGIANLYDIRLRYLDAKEKGTRSVFFEAVAGEKVIYDAGGNPYYLPNEATLIDALYYMYGDEIFWIDHVVMRHDKSLNHVDLNNYHQNFVTGDRIEKADKVFISAFRSPRIVPRWIHQATIPSVKDAIIKKLEGSRRVDKKVLRELAVSLGRDLYTKKFKRSWYASCPGLPSDIDPAAFFYVDPENVLSALSSRYKDRDSFFYDVGMRKLYGDSLENAIAEAVKFRKNMVFIHFHTDDIDKGEGILSERLNKLGIKSTRRESVREAAIPEDKGIRVWIAEKEMGGSPDEVEKNWARLTKDEKGFVYYYSEIPNLELEVVSGELPEMEIAPDRPPPKKFRM